MLRLPVHFLILSLMCSQFVASVGCPALGGVLCLGAMPPCTTQFSFNALFLAFYGPAELLPAVVKHSSAVNRKLFVKTATKTDVALREEFAPVGLGHRLRARSIPRINLQLSYNVQIMEMRLFSIICKFIRGIKQCCLPGRLFRCRGYPRHRAGCQPNKEPGSY